MKLSLIEDNFRPSSSSLRHQIVGKCTRLTIDNHRIVKELEEITGMLSNLDPPGSSLLNSLDLKAQDLSTYFFAAYSDSMDFERSFSVYVTVKALVRHILLSDRYFETGNKKLYYLARLMLERAKENLQGGLKYSLSYSIRQFTPFWQFEQMMKKRMLAGDTFSSKEIAHHNLLKSSDSSLIYSSVLESELFNFDQTVTSVIHYNQALQDIVDDYTDIEEDLRDKMPNIFLLASVSFLPFSKISTLKPDDARTAILESGASGVVAQISQDYMDMIARTELPAQYAFLKVLSQHYFNAIRFALNPRTYESVITS